MCGNRVEELEGRVKELQATVDGLTDELVECKVRIRELENAVDDDTGFDPDEQGDAESAPAPDPETADNTNTEDAESTDEQPTEDESDSESDIIIA